MTDRNLLTFFGVFISLLLWTCLEAQLDCPGKLGKIRCKSYRKELKECYSDEDGPIIDVALDFFAPNSADCTFQSGPPPQDYARDQPALYGFTADKVWTINNCRLTLHVCYSDECVGVACHQDGSCKITENGPECQCNKGLYGDGVTTCSRRCKCSATGDPHYSTFDDQMIHFQGTCEYTLVDTGEGDCRFIVNGKNKRSPRNPKVALTNKITVFVANDKIEVEQGRKVKINGVRYNGPVQNETFEIVHKGNNVYVRNKCGMEAQFNGDTTAKVLIPEDYAASSVGMCGQCDGIQNDFRTKDGTDVSDLDNRYSLIGKSYLAPGVDDNESEECQEDDKPFVCTNDIKEQIASNKYCGKIKDPSGPFKECISAVSEETIQNIFIECDYDACANWGSETDVEEQVCNAMEKLHGECSDAGIDNINYRTASFCPADCGANMEYNSRITSVQPSCKNPNPPQGTEPAVEGCVCQSGFVLDDGTDHCVPVEECGCPDGENYFSVGDGRLNEQCTLRTECVMEAGIPVMRDLPASCGTNEDCQQVAPGVGECNCAPDHVRVNGVCEERCNGQICHPDAVCIREGVPQCRCKDGLYGNGVTGCSERCKCSGTGDPHFKAFDGQMIHFQGNCTYTMVNAGGEGCPFTVNVKNRRSTKNPKVSLVEEITVITSSDTVVIGQGRQVTINGASVSGAVKMDDYEIIVKGSNVIVENNCDMQAIFNGDATAKVLMPKHYAETASGICGKCNGVQDDFRTKDGTDVTNDPNRYSAIGKSYWVGGDGETAEECLSDDETVTCSDDVKQQIASNAYCGLILDDTGPFKHCIPKLGDYINDVYNECEFDCCANWGSETDVMKQVCNAMSKLQGDCNELPISYINYRTASFCPDDCGSKMVYDPALNSVVPSCKNPNPSQLSNGPASEGCKCVEGYLLDDGNNRCVLEEECGCADGNDYYPLWYNQLDEQCTMRTSCLHRGGVRSFKKEPESCGQNAACEVVSPGIGQCNCTGDNVRVNGVCEAPPACPGSTIKIRCKSYKKEYVECDSGSSTPITKIWIRFLAGNSAECHYMPGSPPQDYDDEERGVYGFIGTKMFVDNNCRGNFYVCA